MKRIIITTTLATLAIALIITAGCRKTNQRRDLTQYYQVNYGEGNTYATAGFMTAGGSQNVILERGDNIKANGMASSSPAPYMSSIGGYNWDLGTAQEVTFTLQVDGKTLTNTITPSMVGNMDFTVDSVLSVGDTIRISWTGGPIAENEATFTINGYGDSVMYFGTTSGTFAGETFTFDPTQTRNFVAGTYNITMVKHKTLPLQQSDNGAGGQMVARVIVNKDIVIR